jgi:hypothetical protein
MTHRSESRDLRCRTGLLRLTPCALLFAAVMSTCGGGGSDDPVTGGGTDSSGELRDQVGKAVVIVTSYQCAGDKTPQGPVTFEGEPASGKGCRVGEKRFVIETQSLRLSITGGGQLDYTGPGTYHVEPPPAGVISADRRSGLCADKCSLTVDNDDRQSASGSFSCVSTEPDGTSGNINGTFECTDLQQGPGFLR